eukprot:37578-Pelagomonas_calceolata.AAC.1
MAVCGAARVTRPRVLKSASRNGQMAVCGAARATRPRVWSSASSWVVRRSARELMAMCGATCVTYPR